MNIPNKLTMLRLILMPFIVWFIYIDMSEIAKRRKLCTSVQSEPAISEHAQEHAPPFRAAVLDTIPFLWLAVALFCLAIATDAVDGIIARRKNIKTAFGTFLDPIADKISLIRLIQANKVMLSESF